MTAIAFGSDAKNFLQWQELREAQGVLARYSDHDLAWSLCFHDPYENLYEITTYDYAVVAKALNG